MFLKNALIYSGTNLISQSALFVQGFVLRSMLPPSIMGVWNFVLVLTTFVSPITLGVLQAALRELPILKGKGDLREESTCRSVTLVYTLGESLALTACLLGYAWLKQPFVTHEEFIAILLSGIFLLLNRLQTMYITFFQSVQLYIPLSRLLLVNSLILAVLLPIGAYLFGLWGLFSAALLAESLKAAWMLISGKRHGIHPHLQWETSMFKRLASFGVGYRIADYPTTVFFMLDVLWVTKFMGLQLLAIYAMSRSFFLQISDITVRFGTVFMTRTFEQFGKNESRDTLARNIQRFMQTQLLVALPLVCWAIFSAVPFLIRQVIPLYQEGIVPLAVLLTATFFDLRNNNLFTLWVAEKRLAAYFVSNVLSLFVMGILLFIVYFFMGNKTLTGIAAAVVLGFLFNFTYAFSTIGREYLGWKEALRLYVYVLLTAGFTGGILVYCSLRTPGKVSVFEDFVFSLKQSLLSFALLLPAVLLGLRISGTGKLIYQRWRVYRNKVKWGTSF